MHKHLSDTMVFTLDEAQAYIKIHSPSKYGTASNKKSPPRAKYTAPVCAKCTKAGLTGRVTRHATEACVDKVRKQNLEKVIKFESRKRGRENSIASSGSSQSKRGRVHKTHRRSQNDGDECKTCKNAGRPYRHPAKTCNYAPGGPWHNQSGEKL